MAGPKTGHSTSDDQCRIDGVGVRARTCSISYPCNDVQLGASGIRVRGPMTLEPINKRLVTLMLKFGASGLALDSRAR